MKSIKGRLLQVFFIIIIMLSGGSLFFFSLNLTVIQQYKSISDVMIAEYQIVDATSILMRAYNTRIQSAGTDITDSDNRIQNTKSNIVELMQFLDRNVTDTSSKSNYLGLKSNVNLLIEKIDDSIQKLGQQNIKDYVDDYNKVHQINGFVRDNGTLLFFSELEHASVIRKRIDQNYLITVVLGLTALVVIGVGCVIFSIRFAKKVTDPLVSLTMASKQVAEGNMDFKIDATILQQTNEVGTLALSFHTMTVTLKDKILQLDQAKKKMEDNLIEVERMNTLMVGRELTMIELKKQIQDLTTELEQLRATT